MGTDGFIESVFNYCDRWCERCHLTSRCRVFAQERSEFSDPATQDLANEEFWRSLERTFRGIKETLAEEAEKRGIVLDEKSIEEERQRSEDRFAESQHHPLLQRAEAYSGMARQWLAEKESLVAHTVDRLDLAERLDRGRGANAEKGRIGEAVDVIQYYLFQIQTKLFRTLDADDLESERQDPASDTNGSAKVAIIGLDRSIAAWSVLYEQISAEEDSILDLLLHLDRLRKLTEREFPGARSFVRPGFDTGR